MNSQLGGASASLPAPLQDYVELADAVTAPRAIPPAERIVRQLIEQFKAARATRGTGDDRSFEADVSATSAEEEDLATALWALHKSGYSTAVRHLANGRRVITLSW